MGGQEKRRTKGTKRQREMWQTTEEKDAARIPDTSNAPLHGRRLHFGREW